MAQFIGMHICFHGRKAQLVAAIAVCCLFAGLPLMAQEPPVATQAPAENLDELELVVVHGGYATPQMWKVSRGDHVMWVLGDARAPAGTKWRFEQLEARLAESQLVMYPGHASIGFFKIVGMLTLLPSAFNVQKNPDNKTLKDVLPPEVYERWRALKILYAPRDNDLERLRPSIAMRELGKVIGEKLREKNGSAQSAPPPLGPALRPLVDKAAKKHNVKIRTMPNVMGKFEVKNMRGMLKFVGGFNLVDVKCVTQRLESMERWIEYMKQNAAGTVQGKAPAYGPACDETDLLITKLKSGEIPDTAGILKTMDNMELQEKLVDQQLDAEWISAAQSAMATNRSTFAMLPTFQLKRLTGQLVKLRELGYEVEEPASVVE